MPLTFALRLARGAAEPSSMGLIMRVAVDWLADAEVIEVRGEDDVFIFKTGSLPSFATRFADRLQWFLRRREL